jgi:hypothetical protein
VPGGVRHFQNAHGISGSPESFAEIAALLPVFRLNPSPKDSGSAGNKVAVEP